MTSDGSPPQRLRALAGAATIGTDRAGGDALAADRLLTEAAALGMRVRAGLKPGRHAGRLSECPPDPRPVAPTAAMATLLRLLGDPDAGLIREWSGLAVARGVRVDDVTVPLVLEWWSRQAERSETVFAALGHRGPWLASLNEAWRKPVATSEIPADADEVWATGKATDRLAVLLTVRRHDPARALALVGSTWQQDGAEDRRRFVEALAEQRSMADEPFLEAALDDRSKIVRRQAATLLAGLPGSRLRERMTARARRVISSENVRKGLIGRTRRRIVLTPPEAFAQDWTRDGVDERAPEGVGQRAWWMMQILASADLTVWTDASGLEPDATLDALKDDDYYAAVLQSLAGAARIASDPAWSAALVRSLVGQSPADVNAIGSLLEVLPDAEREPLTLEILGHAALAYIDRWTLLTSFDAHWSLAFSNEAMRLLARDAAPAPQEAYRLAHSLEAASRRIAPEAATAFDDVVAANFPDYRTESVSRSLERVRLRADMHKELS